MLRQFSSILLAMTVPVLAACSKQAPAPDPKIAQGQAVYQANCKVCHAQAINGAPIPGNQKMWGKRAQQGIGTLVQHATEGFGLMPPKGGNASLNSEQLEAAITYMLSKLEDKPE